MKYQTTFAFSAGGWFLDSARFFLGCVSISSLICQEGNGEQQKVCEVGHVSYVPAKHDHHAALSTASLFGTIKCSIFEEKKVPAKHKHHSAVRNRSLFFYNVKYHSYKRCATYPIYGQAVFDNLILTYQGTTTFQIISYVQPIHLDTIWLNPGFYSCLIVSLLSPYKNVLVTICQIDSGCKTAKNAAVYFSQCKMFVQAPISNSLSVK